MPLKNLFESKAYKVFVNRLLIMSLVVVILGAVFSLLHMQGAAIILFLGGGTLLILCLMKLVELFVKR